MFGLSEVFFYSEIQFVVIVYFITFQSLKDSSDFPTQLIFWWTKFLLRSRYRFFIYLFFFITPHFKDNYFIITAQQIV